MKRAEFSGNVLVSQKEAQLSTEGEYISSKIADIEREVVDKFTQKFGHDVGYKLLVEKTFRIVNNARFCQYRVSIHRCEEDGSV